MNRSRFPHSKDPSFVSARETAAVARGTVATAVVLGILAIGVMTACTPRISAAPTAATAPAQAKETAGSESIIEQMKFDPAEVREYTMNVHG